MLNFHPLSTSGILAFSALKPDILQLHHYILHVQDSMMEGLKVLSDCETPDLPLTYCP